MHRFAGAAAVVALALFAASPDARAACCYFAAKDKDISQPGQKAFITWRPAEKVESFTVQPRFEGNALDFGMVIPTPSRPKLDEMPRDFFKDLAIYTILLPLPQPLYTQEMMFAARAGAVRFSGGAVTETATKAPVTVLEAGVVGSLDYKIIVAEEAAALYEWLKENGYSYAGDEATLGFYIEKKSVFTVMKIDSKQMKKNPDGTYLGEITPTRFTFATEKCVYPLKITQVSVKDKTDALFYVQSQEQLDLAGDLSWQHSYRVMVLTFMLGCGATPEEQQELQVRNEWIEKKRRGDPAFETTKLEWARKLGDAEMAVLEDPAASYAQGGGDIARGGKIISREDFLADAKKELGDDEYSKHRIAELEAETDPAKGKIVRFDEPVRFFGTKFVFYPNREAPAEEVKGLSRLKGHLEKGQWLTKFRKQIRKDEMTDDLVLVPVESGREQDYVRIMPTSPP